MRVKIYDTDSAADRTSKKMFGFSATTMKIITWLWVGLLSAIVLVALFMAHA